jgi:hypothetical protein
MLLTDPPCYEWESSNNGVQLQSQLRMIVRVGDLLCATMVGPREVVVLGGGISGLTTA